MSWLHRLFSPASPRGTLTLLDGGRMVLGFPPGIDIRQEDVARFKHLLDEWLASQGALVLSWPVDVTDLRGKGLREGEIDL